jgi:hypothetical protein
MTGLLGLPALVSSLNPSGYLFFASQAAALALLASVLVVLFDVRHSLRFSLPVILVTP